MNHREVAGTQLGEELGLSRPRQHVAKGRQHRGQQEYADHEGANAPL